MERMVFKGKGRRKDDLEDSKARSTDGMGEKTVFRTRP